MGPREILVFVLFCFTISFHELIDIVKSPATAVKDQVHFNCASDHNKKKWLMYVLDVNIAIF